MLEDVLGPSERQVVQRRDDVADLESELRRGRIRQGGAGDADVEGAVLSLQGDVEGPQIRREDVPRATHVAHWARSADRHPAKFRSVIDKTKVLSDRRMTQYAALKMIQRRGLEAGIHTPVCCHGFRATGITISLTNGGTLEKAPPQRISNRELSRLVAVG
jgi:integrase